MVACDFFITVTARFRFLYVFVFMELGTRRIRHWNITAHPTAEWTNQQFREAISWDPSYRFLIHDRDAIFSAAVVSHLRGEELVASYLYHVHLYHWLESNDYGRFLSDNDL